MHVSELEESAECDGKGEKVQSSKAFCHDGQASLARHPFHRTFVDNKWFYSAARKARSAQMKQGQAAAQHRPC